MIMIMIFFFIYYHEYYDYQIRLCNYYGRAPLRPLSY